jgi:hypothetical protein
MSNQFEKKLESDLCAKVLESRTNSEKLCALRFSQTSSTAMSLGDLIGARDFDLFQDTSDWNQHKHMLVDISGGMNPDIVIRSKSSGENRIIIEVKCESGLTYTRVDSQIVRYFIHLLATTLHRKGEAAEIRRAVVLAAPDSWLTLRSNKEDWDYFWNTYVNIAGAFGVTLARMRLPEPR